MSIMAKTKKKKGKRIVLTLQRFERSELQEALNRLFVDLSNATDEVRKRTLSFFNFPSKLVSLEVGVTPWATMPILIKPSNLLLDLCFAVRTGNFDFCVVEHPHGFSSVGNGLVELPILSTLEKLPISEKEAEE